MSRAEPYPYDEYPPGTFGGDPSAPWNEDDGGDDGDACPEPDDGAWYFDGEGDGE